MEVVNKIYDIMKKRNLTEYQLAKLSGLSISTLSNMRKRQSIPSIPTLEIICKTLNISLSQFFVDENTYWYPVSKVQKEFLNYYICLSDKQQAILLELIRNIGPLP